MTYFFRLIAVFSLLLAVCRPNVNAQDESPLFILRASETLWDDTNNPGVELTSKDKVGGTLWKTWGFTHSGYLWKCGIRDLDYTSYIWSVDPVEAVIGKVSVSVTTSGDSKYLEGLSLMVSDTPHFENCTEIKQTVAENGVLYNFTIEKPEPDKYYRINVSFKAYNTNWISIPYINFYASKADDNGDGNGDNSGTGNGDNSDDNGGDNNGDNTGDNGGYGDNNGEGDDDRNDTGDIESSIDSVRIDDTTLWFDLQGNRIAEPKKGVCIKLTGGKATKVTVK